MTSTETELTDDPYLGTVFGGRYRAVEKIGEGGWGAVYKGIQLNLDQDVAIKILKKEVATDETMSARFCNEARIYARINNPHVVAIHDFGQENNGALYLVMEYLPGKNLSEIIEERGPFEPKMLVELACQIVEGLEAAHDLGVVHRDIKPANISIQNLDTPRPFARLLDFGVSKVGDETDAMESTSKDITAPQFIKGLTMVGQVAGTPAFMSPEQCQGMELDARSDIYAIGMVMYTMACGRPPFASKSLREIMHMQCTETPPALAEFYPRNNIPGELEDVIMMCLRKSSKDRYESTRELLKDLEQIQKELVTDMIVPLVHAQDTMDETNAVPVSKRAFGSSKENDENAAALATEVMNTLSKAFRSFILYPRNNPIIHQTTAKLEEFLAQYNKEFGELVLHIDRIAVFHRNRRIFEESDLRVSFPFKLFSDGIRRLIFHKDIELEQISSFLECLQEVTQKTNTANDLVTLFWERRFTRITYLTLDELTTESLPDADELATAISGIAYTGRTSSEDISSKSSPSVSNFGGAASEHNSQLSEEDIQSMRQLIQTEQDADHVAEIIRSLLSVLFTSTEEDEIKATIKVITDLTKSLLWLGDIHHAAMVLKACRRALLKAQNMTVLSGLSELIEEAATPVYIDTAIDWLESEGGEENAKVVGEYFTLLNPTVAPLLVERLDRLDPTTQRPTIQWAIMKLCGKLPALISNGLYAEQVGTQIATLQIFGAFDASEATDYVAPILKDPTPEVRAEAIKSLKRMKSPNLGARIVSLLDDTSSTVRLATMEALTCANSPAVVDKLLSLLAAPDFSTRPQEEQLQVLEALKANPKPEVIEALSQIVVPGALWLGLPRAKVLMGAGALVMFPVFAKFFGLGMGAGLWLLVTAAGIAAVTQLKQDQKSQADELVEPAARALHKIGSNESQEALMRAAKYGSPKTRRIVAHILDES